MTKKDYILIADCLVATNKRVVNNEHLQLLVWNLIPMLQQENHKFDSNKFVECLEKRGLELE